MVLRAVRYNRSRQEFSQLHKSLYRPTFDSWCMCSNLQHLWITCVILSNCCHFSHLVLCTYPLLLHLFLSSYLTFVALSNFFHLLTLCSPFTLSTHPINVPALHTKQHNSYSSLIERTSSRTLSQTNRCLWPPCHSDVGGSRRGWRFLLGQTNTLYTHSHRHLALHLRYPGPPTFIPQCDDIQLPTHPTKCLLCR